MVAGAAAAAHAAPRPGVVGRDAARDWLVHALGCACLALRDPDCAPLLGPPVPGATLPLGARVPGTSLELDPASAAFNLGAMIRGERASPADHVAAALAAADYAARHAYYDGVAPPTVADLLAALRQAEAFARALAGDDQCRGDPWLCQRAADAFVATALLGGSAAQQFDAARRASLDGSPAAAARRHARPAPRAAPGRRRERRTCAAPRARGVARAVAGGRDSRSGGRQRASPAPHAGHDDGHDDAPARLRAPALEHACLGGAFAAAVAAVYPAAQAAAIVGALRARPGTRGARRRCLRRPPGPELTRCPTPPRTIPSASSSTAPPASACRSRKCPRARCCGCSTNSSAGTPPTT